MTRNISITARNQLLAASMIALCAAILTAHLVSADAEAQAFTPLPQLHAVILDEGEGTGTISVEPASN